MSTDAAIDVPKNKQQLRTERSSNALLEAASDLIVEGGLDALTFAAIGERAGYSRGLVSARFGSKNGLIEALIDRIVMTWSHKNVIPRTSGRTGLEGALVMIDAIRAQAEKDPRGLRVLYSVLFEAVGSEEALRVRFAKFHETMRNDLAHFVRKGQNDGSVNPELDPDREGVLLVSSLRGIGYQWLLDSDEFDVVDALRYLTETATERLTA